MAGTDHMDIDHMGTEDAIMDVMAVLLSLSQRLMLKLTQHTGTPWL